jgi:hypothetical protein
VASLTITETLGTMLNKKKNGELMCQQRTLIVLFFPTHLARPNIRMGKRVQHFGIEFVIITIKIIIQHVQKSLQDL